MPNPRETALARTFIRNIAWLVAWDEAAQSHVYRRSVDLTIEGETVTGIGFAEPEPHGVEIDGSGSAIFPGFVNIHAHPSCPHQAPIIGADA